MERTSFQIDQRKRILRILTSIALVAFALLAGIVIFVLVFSDMLLNRYAKDKIEKVFAGAAPGYVLRIGRIHYSIIKNSTECLNVSFSAADSSLLCSAGSFSLSGIGWKQLIYQQKLTPGVVKHSVLIANDVLLHLPRPGYDIHCGHMSISIPDSEITVNTIFMEFAESRYQLHCGLLRASVADSELSAEGIVLGPLAGDDDFFSASAFRRTRFSLNLPHCRLRRASVFDLIQGKSYKAGMLEIFHPEFDLLVNRDKPVNSGLPRPRMPAEALAAFGRPIHLDTLAMHDARLVYGERREEKGDPGILTFERLHLSVLGIGNSPRDVAVLRGRGRFMNAGMMKVVMNIPMKTRGFSLSYSGSLTGMDAMAFNRFLEPAEHVRITTGTLHDFSFDVHVARGRGSGKVKMIYDDLYITLLDKQTGSKDVFGKQLATWLANFLKISGSTISGKSGSVKIGTVDYTCKSTDTFVNIIWFSLRDGIGDIVGF